MLRPLTIPGTKARIWYFCIVSQAPLPLFYSKTSTQQQRQQPNLSNSAHKVAPKLHPKQMAKYMHPESIKIERVESLAPQTKSTVGGADFEEVYIDGSDMIAESNNKTTNQQQSAAQETSDVVVYMCTPCQTYFPTKAQLEVHHKESHATTKPAVKKVKLQQLLMQLKQEQQPKPKPRFDQEENKVFFQLYHKDLNTNEFVCNFCPYRSVIRTTVSSHAKRNHMSVGSDNEEEEESFEMIKTKQEQDDVDEEEEDELYDETLVDEMKMEVMDEEMIEIQDEDDESSWPIETVDETFEEQMQNHELEVVSDSEDRIRTCPYCSFQSTVTSTYHSHVKRKHREEWAAENAMKAAMAKTPEGPELQCQHCDFTTYKRNTLHSHVKRKHGLKRKLDETDLDDVDDNFVEVKEELLDESEAALADGASESDVLSKIRSCPYCSFQTRNTSTFNSHVLRKHGSNAKRSASGLAGASSRAAASKKSKAASNSFMITGYACHYCAFVAATIHSLTSHNTRMHASMKQPVQEIPTDQFDCDRCEYKTRNRRNMQTHLKKNHKGQANADGMYCCNACSYETMSHMGLQRHMSIKHQKPNLTNNVPCYQCEVCEFKCLNIKIMDWHLKSHCSDNRTKAEESGIIFFCNDCDFSTWLKTLLFSHIRRKHKDGEGKDEQDEGEPLFVCEQCDYSTKNKHVMKVHVIRKHTENYSHECDICGKKYKVKADLTNHVRFKHREQPIICDVCGKTCQNSNLLYLHQKFAHYKPEFECPICHRRMVSQANLDDHILKQHEQRENVVCHECGKQFTRASRLKIHMRTHTGLKPYSCQICLKSFARRNGLRQHLLIHTGKKPYSCDLCDKSFTQKTGLISHRKSHPGSHPPLPRVTIDHVLSNLLEEKQ
ncbi:hypothetical protein TKK_0011479 [Trichogramma kaykai]|uniref:C2H2-type domain-containing protein n=1 Tax=Trichogramma kaykai TaxID=54128 RepID=A0ABD2WQY9_9HYME